jgi:hypothetical protein
VAAEDHVEGVVGERERGDVGLHRRTLPLEVGADVLEVRLDASQSSKIRSGAKWRTRSRSVTVFATGTQKRAFCAVGDLCRFITDYLSCVRGAS